MVAATVDAGEHLGLIPHVIRQMGLKGDLAEEAYSEGLVSIVKAAKKFDPSKDKNGKLLAAWLAKNLRWDIQNMLAKVKPVQPLEVALESATMPQNDRSEFNQLVERAKKLLTPTEHKILMASAFGYRNEEIARALKIMPATVTALKRSARIKLEESRGE